MDDDSHPYVVFLPSEHKIRILSAIFGSRAAVDILKLSLDKGISEKLYQQELGKKLSYSNKTIIKNLKSLTKLDILQESMEKSEKNQRIVWVKAYQLSDMGKWFSLLLAEEKDLSESEKAQILESLFRTYIRWVKDLSSKLHLSKGNLEKAFREEMNRRVQA